MSINLATWERALRIVIGLFLIALVYVGPKTALGWLAAIPLFTGLSGYCPLYRIFRFSTFRPTKPAGSG
jgi:hypothetical protein